MKDQDKAKKELSYSDIVLQYLTKGVELVVNYTRKNAKKPSVTHDGTANLIFKNDMYYLHLYEIDSDSHAYVEDEWDRDEELIFSELSQLKYYINSELGINLTNFKKNGNSLYYRGK